MMEKNDKKYWTHFSLNFNLRTFLSQDLRNVSNKTRGVQIQSQDKCFFPVL